MSVNEKMTAIADGVRTLSGESGKMGLDAMSEKIATANTTVDGQSDLIYQIKVALRGKAAGSGSSSGIIEVPELPTSDIDENAVYNVVVNTESEVYIILGGVLYTVEEYAVSIGMGCFVYYVDELPSNMEVTSRNLYLYILNSSGIGYIDFAASGNTQQFGAVLLGSEKYDRGYTDNINEESLDGVYVTRSEHEDIWFIRENGEWKRISPDKQKKVVEVVKFGETAIYPDEGKTLSSVTVVVRVPSAGDILNNQLEELTEEHFIKSNGDVCYFFNDALSGNTYLKQATIHKDVKVISRAFSGCSSLETVTFKGRPTSISNDTFSGCTSLTAINVPWSYGGVSGAPWGATNETTINYNVLVT